ncbi:uncharacterized protein LOC129758669 [Uranotaenia lowii]|uniref:uncharacterized protein LOC129758669 n=1 Tax=Uranotaenia lowii TaxID=190385 RepID=UPI002479CE63|nr:uncharacterized protein LOC129758669 [Uranotaenia lowii]
MEMKQAVEDSIELTEVEKAAKSHFSRIIAEGSSKPCDVGSPADLEFQLPAWFDEEKFKRGQKYFRDNRFGMMLSNMCGLISLLSDPKGLNLLHNTGKSSTPETARKRYISTTLHMLSWYEIDLTPGSKSWLSLQRVRKMHLSASNSSSKTEVGCINQMEVSFTTFGFMGYALIRPHLLGIRSDNDADREAFVHFWAVMGSMLGVEDQYNMCLPDLAVVEMICRIFLRYVFLPLIQFESPLFKQMVNAIMDGLSEFNPVMSYGSMLCFMRRVAGVPGYQYNVDLEKEIICRPIFSANELSEMRKSFVHNAYYEWMDNILVDGRINLYEVRPIAESCSVDAQSLDGGSVTGSYRAISENETNKLRDIASSLLGLKNTEELVKITITEGDWSSHLNDSKINLLSGKDLRLFKVNCRLIEMNKSWIGNYINETMLSLMLYRMRKALEK